MTESCFIARRRRVTKALLYAPLIALGLCPAFAQYYTKRLQGRVTDSNGEPLKGAAVTLTNLQTLSVRSYITQKNGKYHFSGVSTKDTYEVKARYSGHWSSTKTLSKFDSSETATIDIKIDLNH
jgi:uncharacterized protein YfaS (alpha-2-macroglobulin family)